MFTRNRIFTKPKPRLDSELHETFQDYSSFEKNWADLETTLAYLDTDSVLDNASNFLVSYGAKKYIDESDWIIYQNSHPALISEEVGQVISELKEKGKHANRCNKKRTCVLYGLLKCGDWG